MECGDRKETKVNKVKGKKREEKKKGTVEDGGEEGKEG